MTPHWADAIEWRVPWFRIANDRVRSGLENELVREVAPGHQLHGREVQAVARRQDCDDVLFAFATGTECAVVHLTYPSAPPDRPPWPHVVVFRDSATFVAECMLPDHSDFGS